MDDDGVYEYKGGMHQRHRHWYRIVNGKIVDSDQYLHNLKKHTLPPETRTCETCSTGCLPNERVYINPDVEDPCPGWTPRSPQSADVETVKIILKRISELLAEKDVTKRTYYEEMALEGVYDALKYLEPRT